MLVPLNNERLWVNDYSIEIDVGWLKIDSNEFKIIGVCLAGVSEVFEVIEKAQYTVQLRLTVLGEKIVIPKFFWTELKHEKTVFNIEGIAG